MIFRIFEVNFFVVFSIIIFIEENFVLCENNLGRFKRLIKNKCTYGYVPNNDGPCESCGSVYYNQNSKIVGGVEAVPGSWPAQVLILNTISGVYRIPENNGNYYQISKSSICGGTLISQYAVLTAAHCITTQFDHTIGQITYSVSVKNPYDASQFSVYVGAHGISFLTNPQFLYNEMAVKRIIRHPNYNTKNEQNDIAVYHLVNPVRLSPWIQPACLPNPADKYYPPDNSLSFASGWGSKIEGGSPSQKLYNVQLTVYNSQFCSQVASSSAKNWNSQICAGAYTGGKDTCQGDSGGGLYTYDSVLKKYILAGITSYGTGCARSGFPGIYTRVSFYNDWILSNMINTGNKAHQNLLLIFPLSVVVILKLLLFK